MKRFFRFFIVVLVLSAGGRLYAGDDSPPFSVQTDGRGGYVYRWDGQSVAFVLDSDQDKIPELAEYFWGRKTLRAFIDADKDGMQETMATFDSNGGASFFIRSEKSRFRIATRADEETVAKAKTILNDALVRRIAVDDGSMELRDANAADAPKIVLEGEGDPALMTVILFPSCAPSAELKAEGITPLPIRLPDIAARIGAPFYTRIPDWSVPADPFDDSKTVKATFSLSLFRFFVQPMPSGTASSESTAEEERMEACFHIRMDGGAEERFCVEDAFPNKSAFFASSPGIDLRGKIRGSWLVEIHKPAAGR